MIFSLDKSKRHIERIQRCHLSDIGLKEIDLQRILFDNLEKVLPDEELLLISQSRKWQEEPDLMAIDSVGDLYLFELKAWESAPKHLLQVLRYGQIFGQYNYEKLDGLFHKSFPESEPLVDVLNHKFETSLTKEQINEKQHFIVITNGLDFETRQAVQYWSDNRIDVRSWIYRIFKKGKETLVEFNTFSLRDDPYEDIEQGYYILNTDFGNTPENDADMLASHKAAAYFTPWKRHIEKLKKNDKVFLYRSGEGIVAMGIASGKLEKKDYHNDPKHKDEEYYMKLNRFKKLTKQLPASEIKRITETNYRFMSTMFGIDQESGEKLWVHITSMTRE